MTGPIRRVASLEYRLPLLISALLVTLVTIGAVLAYQEVRRLAVVAATERLERVSTQLAELTAQSTTQRLEQMREIAASSAVRSVLSTGRMTAEAEAALEELRVTGDSLPLELWGGAAGSLTGFGAYPREWSAQDRTVTRAHAASAPADGGYTPIFRIDGRAHVWTIVPVPGFGDSGGWMAHLRPVGNPESGTSRQISRLIGSTVEVYFTTPGDDWVSLGGDVVRGQPDGPPAEVTEYERDGVAYLGRGADVGEHPLAVVVEMPMREVLARPTTFLRRLLVGSAFLIILGTLGAWVVSRRITRPVRTLSEAAGEFAGGQYGRRVRSDRQDELGVLARSFNAMAAEIQGAIATVERARAEAESANDAKSRFLANMSHEIRTPINAIIGYTDLMIQEIAGPITPEQRQHLERLRASGRHLTGLVDDVLDLARIESDHLRVSDGTGSAREAVESAVAVVAPEAEEARLALVLPGDDTPDVPYRGDPQRVQQILINLLSNAIKFTAAGGRVEVRIAREGDRARIDVIDTGDGIPADRQEEIFEPFIQLEGGLTRERGGAGLGLPISRRLAALMGGSLTVESEPGNGSTFTLWLPVDG